MFFVYGLQKSGISIIKLLEKNNQEFRIWDDDSLLRKKLIKIFDKKIFLNPKKNNLNHFKKIYVSPGISIRQNKFQIKKKSIKINRDLNLYNSNLTNENVIAITGTNGKSTTTKLIGDLLKYSNKKVFVGGNIGEPLCNSFISNKYYRYHVIELSSFQLETIKNLNPKISIITNLSYDHLDRYKNISDYIKQKKNIISKTGINLFSIDDKFSKKIYKQKKIKNKISFSMFDKSADVYFENNFIVDNHFKKNKKLKIKNFSEALIPHYNLQNVIITYICCKLLKLQEKTFLKLINKFKGLPYRANIIFKRKGLKIINNSKSTNINSSINSIQNYNNIYLILGGIAKEKNFEDILKYKEKIKFVYVYGKSAITIQNKLKQNISVKKFNTLKQVVKKVLIDVEITNISSTILFAPACTSYDQFTNFEERGKQFSKLIKINLGNL